jgi:hypothetical protein
MRFDCASAAEAQSLCNELVTAAFEDGCCKPGQGELTALETPVNDLRVPVTPFIGHVPYSMPVSVGEFLSV